MNCLESLLADLNSHQLILQAAFFNHAEDGLWQDRRTDFLLHEVIVYSDLHDVDSEIKVLVDGQEHHWSRDVFLPHLLRNLEAVLSRKKVVHQDDVDLFVGLELRDRFGVIFLPDNRKCILVKAAKVHLHQLGKILVVLDKEYVDFLFVQDYLLADNGITLAVCHPMSRGCRPQEMINRTSSPSPIRIRPKPVHRASP